MFDFCWEILLIALIILSAQSSAMANSSYALERKLVQCITLLEKQPEGKISDVLLDFVATQGSYINHRVTPRLEQLLERKPDSPFLCYQLGLIYSDNIIKHTKAADMFESGVRNCELIKQSKYIPFFDYRLASLWLLNGKYDTAIRLLNTLKKDTNFPYLAQVYNKSGVGYYYQDMLSEAISDFKTALIIDSKYTEARFNLKSINMKLEHFNAGRVYLRTKQYSEAEMEFTKAVEKSPNFVMARHFLGLAYAYQNKPDKAIKEYERALIPSYKLVHEVHNLLGSSYIIMALNVKENSKLKSEYLKKGIAELKSALAVNPNFGEARKSLANTCRNLDLAELMGISHLEAGNEYMQMGLFAQAVESFGKVLQKEANNKLAYLKKSEAVMGWARSSLCDKKKYDRTITICKKFIPDISSGSVREGLLLFLGYAYMQKGKTWYGKAVESLSKVLNPQAHYYMGLIYFNQGAFARALSEFQKARKSDMDNPEYFFMLAKLHFYLKNYNISKELFQKSLEILELQLEKNKAEAGKLRYFSERKVTYEKDLAFIQRKTGVGDTRFSHINHSDTAGVSYADGQKTPGISGTLPSDRETVALLINSENLNNGRRKSIYKYIKRVLSKQVGLIVVDYRKYKELVTEKVISENCSTDECLSEYTSLTNTQKLLLVDLDQWSETLLVSFSLYVPEANYKKSIYEHEFHDVKLYKSIEQSLEKVAIFLKKQRVRVYCELCPQI